MTIGYPLAAYYPTFAVLPVAFLALYFGFALRLILRTRSLRWASTDLMAALLYAAVFCGIGAALTDPGGIDPGYLAFWVVALLLACWDDWRRWQR